MIKVSARKLMDGCGHSVPILVPCESCVAARVGRILADQDGETRRDTKESLENIQRENSTTADMMTKLKSQLGRVEGDRNQAVRRVNELSAKVIDLERRLKNTESMLTAERRDKLVIPVRKEDEDGAFV